MRVTSNTFPNRLLTQLGDLATRQAKFQAQAATGQRIQNASDDPAAMRRVLEMQAEASGVEQFSANIAQLKDATTASYSGMRALKTISNRASEIAIAADGLEGSKDREIFANELDQLIEEAALIGNTTFRGDYLFAGTAVDKPPFEIVKDAEGKITGVNYTGNSEPIMAEINPNVLSEAQPVGVNTSGAGPRGLLADSRSGADLFNHLISLRDNLLAGNAQAIKETDRVNLAKDEDNFIYHYGHIGALQSRLDAADGLAKNQSFSIDQQVSGLVDADLAQTMVRLTQVQNAYTAALQTGGTILNTSLLDYIR